MIESPWNSGGLPTQVPFSSVPLYGAVAFPGVQAATSQTSAATPTPSATPLSTTDDQEHDLEDEEERASVANDSGLDLGGIRIPLVLVGFGAECKVCILRLGFFL